VKLPEIVMPIWRVVKVVQIAWGFSLGLYIFTYGPYLYENFGGSSGYEGAMLLTTVWFATGLALEALLEVPTGAIGDAIGRKHTVIWSMICRGCFFIFLSLASVTTSISLSFTLAMLANIAFAFAYTFFSGTFTAWCVDSLRQRAPEIGYEHILARGYTYSFIARLIGGVLGVLCYTHDIAYAAFLLGAFVCIPCVTVCAAEMDETYAPQLRTHRVQLSDITRRIGEIIGVGFHIFRNSKPILFLTLLFASYMFLMNIVDYLWPVSLRANIAMEKQNIYWIGLVIIFLAASALGSRAVGLLGKKWSGKTGLLKTHNSTLRMWLVGSCFSCGIPVVLLGWYMSNGHVQFPLFVTSIILIQIAYGMVLPCYETLVNNYIPEENSQERATILSFGSLTRSVFVVLLGIPAGGTSAKTTTVGWMLPAAMLVIMAVVTSLVLRKHEKLSMSSTIEQGGRV
jgi:MFS family permease